MNSELRIKILEMVKRSGEGHIPSSFSIVDIIEYLYSSVLKYDCLKPKWSERDYFILSKGHGAGALYAVLHAKGVLKNDDIINYGTPAGILGGHPDSTIVPGAEASTGSLGHGFPTAVGIALGNKILGLSNKVFALLGDGECHEGTIWEAANIATNQELRNICAIVDWNGSAAQLMPRDDLPEKWKAFGWETFLMDGHSKDDFEKVFALVLNSKSNAPKAIIAKTIKGKGVSFMEGHGKWHHRVPTDEEMDHAILELKNEK
ncbi:transketolase [Polynucleobacter sp. MG-6-Vaara-E2]|uniref:transketolase n=1 Tax=Polynucleobacter sp. MG-6-Vaara-E2 TaxID=2576932 RepID=UPI001BFE6FA9|nr:transketolase [Polynucleobacter sp. MG-6-Vaara-E2]QWD96908.1 transketolase [Polynucleobacter sp. MG-6-Vaara-E2]